MVWFSITVLASGILRRLPGRDLGRVDPDPEEMISVGRDVPFGGGLVEADSRPARFDEALEKLPLASLGASRKKGPIVPGKRDEQRRIVRRRVQKKGHGSSRQQRAPVGTNLDGGDPVPRRGRRILGGSFLCAAHERHSDFKSKRNRW